MRLTQGLVQDFLDLLGFQAVSNDGVELAFTITSALLAMVMVTFMILLFKFFCYLKRH